MVKTLLLATQPPSSSSSSSLFLALRHPTRSFPPLNRVRALSSSKPCPPPRSSPDFFLFLLVSSAQSHHACLRPRTSPPLLLTTPATMQAADPVVTCPVRLSQQHCQRREAWKAPGARPPFQQGHRQVPHRDAEARYVGGLHGKSERRARDASCMGKC